MDILLRNFTDKQKAAIESARGDTKLQAWGASALLDAAKYKGPRDNFEAKPKAVKPKKTEKAPRPKKPAAKGPAKKRVPVRPAKCAGGKCGPRFPVIGKVATTKKDEAWRLEPQFRDKAKKKL